MKLGCIGTGMMASAMLKGVIASGFLSPEEITVYDKSPAAMRKAQEQLGVQTASCAEEVFAAAQTVQLGVKPQDMPALLGGLSDTIRQTRPLLLSIAAGIKLSVLDPAEERRVVRLMPNINATVGQAMTAYCPNPRVTGEEVNFTAAYCACFGKAVALEEKHFSAYCALAGSAPAFVFLFLDELARAGVSAGLPKAAALEIATQTVLGSAETLRQSGDTHPYALIDQVCSPAGTTIAGINALREHGFAHALSQAVLAAYRRDIALG
ncbi:MAG: pyrroline-5-carboxylate reductase [Oscillospiraceae bacterium]|jgi:pyrroline-5-carboxylate reductase|nr:pyrroline-5-carboxylate reductase [Oscillospiraceae bacterium]